MPVDETVSPVRVLITAGPTHEPIDAVRYIANRSSGRMGVALAEAARRRGWPTTLLMGPVPQSPDESSQVRVRRFRTTADLRRLLGETWPAHDLLIMAAAVADYRPKEPAIGGKLHRSDGPLRLELEPTPDLLAELCRQPGQRIVGFALEPAEDLDEAALAKLHRKRLDAIVANPLETMDAATVTASLIHADGRRDDAPADLPKADFADWLMDRVSAIQATQGADRPMFVEEDIS